MQPQYTFEAVQAGTVIGIIVGPEGKEVEESTGKLRLTQGDQATIHPYKVEGKAASQQVLLGANGHVFHPRKGKHIDPIKNNLEITDLGAVLSIQHEPDGTPKLTMGMVVDPNIALLPGEGMPNSVTMGELCRKANVRSVSVKTSNSQEEEDFLTSKNPTDPINIKDGDTVTIQTMPIEGPVRVQSYTIDVSDEGAVGITAN